MQFASTVSGKWLRISPATAACFLILLGILLSCCRTALSQEEGDDNPRGNVHLGTTLTGALNPAGRFNNFGWGVTTGGGYNFSRRHALVGEFMWDHLFMSGNAVSAIRLAAQDPTIDGRGDLFALTGNYRYELRGKALGAYFIAGGGLYHRTLSLSRRVTTGNNITCEPTWSWWGFSCSSGLVTAGQTIIGSSSSALGVNGGFGLTVRVGEAPYRVYVESRYHYAPTKQISSQFIAISIGIRY